VTILRPLTHAAALIGSVSTAQALAPPLPCEGYESGMITHDLTILDPDLHKSGVTIERYQVDMQPDDSHNGVFRPVPAPVAALDGFFGVRVMHCATGHFHAIETTQRTATVAAALGATEFLRASVKDGQPVSRAELADAVRAVYGKQIQLRETEETCGCNGAFPELRPKGMTAYEQRTDTSTR